MTGGTLARPARATGSPSGPRPPGGPGDAGRRAWLLGTAAVLVVVSLVVAGAWLPRLARTLTTRAGDQSSATEASSGTEELACSTTEAIDVSADTSASTPTGSSTATSAATPTSTPTDSRGWEEAWRLDSGMGDWEDNRWPVISAGNCLVIASGSYGRQKTLTGYRLTESGPEHLWTQSPVRTGQYSDYYGEYVWWGERLIAGDQLLDPAQGTSSEAPWFSQAYSAVAVTSELAIACRTATSSVGDPAECSAWDWNNGSPKRRWQRTYRVDSITLLPHRGVIGAAADGSVLVSVEAASTQTEDPKESDESQPTITIQPMSLADGSLGNGATKSDRSGADAGAGYIPARDGWIRVSASGTEATVISSGDEDGQTFPVQGIPAVLLVDGQAPTVSQLRTAYETGDTSWADTVLDCDGYAEDTGDASCTLNGSPVALPDESLSEWRLKEGGYQALTRLSSDGRTLMIPETEIYPSYVVLIDTVSRQAHVPAISEQQDGTLTSYTARATEDLVLVVAGSQVVAYSPTG